jgi:hypothetical protein
MRYQMFARLVPVLMCAASVAHASPLRPLADAQLPERCRPLAAVPVSAVISDPDFAAHVSVASCLAEEALAAAPMRADAAGVAALDRAVAPALAILDDVIGHGDAHWRAFGEAAKADLYRGLAVRLRASVPSAGDRSAIEALVAPWLDRGAKADASAAAPK